MELRATIADASGVIIVVALAVMLPAWLANDNAEMVVSMWLLGIGCIGYLVTAICAR